MIEQINYANLSMEQLCDMLSENETEQNEIYKIYARAAEMDENMREFKAKEKIIRIWMAAKVPR